MTQTLQELVPWLPTLPFAAKVSLSVVIAAALFFLIAIIWSRSLTPPSKLLAEDHGAKDGSSSDIIATLEKLVAWLRTLPFAAKAP